MSKRGIWLAVNLICLMLFGGRTDDTRFCLGTAGVYAGGAEGFGSFTGIISKTSESIFRRTSDKADTA